MTDSTDAERRFSEHFHALTSHLSEAELSIALGRSIGAVRGLRGGPTKMLKLDVALRLCRYLTEHGRPTSPWELIGEEPPTSATQLASVAAETEAIGHATGTLEGAVRDLVAEVRTLRDRVDQIESAPAKKTATRRAAS